jgi:hypothetical protein
VDAEVDGISEADAGELVNIETAATAAKVMT